MPTTRFFPEARLNVAENLLDSWDGEEPAIIAHDEAGHRRELSGRRLREEVAALAAALPGVGGDGRRSRGRVAAQRARGRRRDAGRDLARRAVLLVLAGLRHPRCARPVRPDRAGRAASRPTATATTATAIDCLERLAGDPAGLPTLRDHRRGPDAVGGPGPLRDQCGGEVGPSTSAGRPERADVRPASPSTILVRAVLVGHDRPAEVHRPPGGRGRCSST